MKLLTRCLLASLLPALFLGLVGLVVISKGGPKMTHAIANHEIRTRKNRLQSEKSPYLLQHATNPVDWYPWGKEAFEKARRENKPIFLSIGYSTCHWCHVMAHESFEDPEVAQLMNETFVCIKVDREERPDVDNVYMTVCQMMTGGGGWPLTILMTPDKKPFMAATYIPRETRFGRMGMVELVPRIKTLWATDQGRIVQSANQIVGTIRRASMDGQGEALDASTLKETYDLLVRRFDREHGGQGTAPKFPTPHHLMFLLRYHKRTGDPEPLAMAEKTLQAMRRGGIYDHIGFGFHRYATDSEWLVPHFEKMLYDQALLTIAYLEAHQVTGKTEYAATAREILTYVLRDMTSPEGGFYSAEDADSEGVEGKFYLWSKRELREVLTERDAELVVKAFNVEAKGNFNEESTGERTGSNILHLTRPLDELAAELNIDVRALRDRLASARQKLFAHREGRVHPHKDDKILTDWNGLMIAALARAAQVFDDPSYTEAANRAADFILTRMRTPQGRLIHRYRSGQAGLPAHVDDYAFLIWGLIELYETTFEPHRLRTAVELTGTLTEHYWDEEGGGFYFTADDGEALLVRQKEIYDGAVPSGNSVAMWNLLRLGRLTGNADLERRASTLCRAFSKIVGQLAGAYTQLMVAVDFAVGPAHEVVIAGRPDAEDTRAMLRALRQRFLPNAVVLLRPTDQPAPAIVQLAGFVEHHTSIDGKATAYVCANHSCKHPTTKIDEMLTLIEQTQRRRLGQGRS